MIKPYKPRHLNNEIDNLRKRFDPGRPIPPSSDKELKALLEKIVACKNDKELKRLSIVLTNAQIAGIAGCIKTNPYNVDIHKVIRLFVVSHNERAFHTIYEDWQNDFRNPFQQTDIYPLIVEYKEYISNDLNTCRFLPLNDNTLYQYMTNNKADESIAKELAGTSNSNTQFLKRLKQTSILENSVLYTEITKLFMLVCKGSVFLDLGDTELVRLLRKEPENTAGRILIHFLDVVKISNYPNFIQLAQFAYAFRNTHYFKNSQLTTDNRIKHKYDSLVNLIWLIKVLEDNRLYFWNEYIAHFKARYFSQHEMLLMDFGKYYAVEFKEVGPVYFFEKDYYYKRYLKHGLPGNTVDLKRKMRNDTTPIKYMKEHRGYWQDEVHSALKYRKMI